LFFGVEFTHNATTGYNALQTDFLSFITNAGGDPMDAEVQRLIKKHLIDVYFEHSTGDRYPAGQYRGTFLTAGKDQRIDPDDIALITSEEAGYENTLFIVVRLRNSDMGRVKVGGIKIYRN
jgi:hypothetical protein